MGYCYFLQKGNPDGTIDAWSMWSDCACRIAYWKWPRRVSSVNGLGWVLACKMGMLYGVLLILWRSSEFKIDELNTQLFEFDCGFHPVRRACTGLHETEESCSMADCSCIISQKWWVRTSCVVYSYSKWCILTSPLPMCHCGALHHNDPPTANTLNSSVLCLSHFVIWCNVE